MFLRVKRARGVDYLQLVENERLGTKVQQRVLASLGRADDLRRSGELDRLISTGAALSRRAVVLVPPDPAARLELVADESLQDALVARLMEIPSCAEVVSAFCSVDPERRRRLMAAATFTTLAAAGASRENQQALLALGREEHGSMAEGEGTILTLARAVNRGGPPPRENGLLIGVRMAGAATPSLMRGLVACVATDLEGMPIAAGHWSAHQSPLKTVVDIAAHLGKRLATRDVIVSFDRAFGSEAFLSALGKLRLGFVIPMRESPVRLDRRSAAGWSSHEVRAPHKGAGGATAGAGPELRYIQIVDPAAVALDWRLRTVQIERIDNTLAGVDRSGGGHAFARLTAMRNDLVERERWDGTTLLATNLKLPAEEIARRYAVEQDVRAWERDMTEFGERLLEADASPSDITAMLTGGAAVALMAAYLRFWVLRILSLEVERPASWSEVAQALNENRSARISQGDRLVTLSPEPSPALIGLLRALRTNGGDAGPLKRKVVRMRRSGPQVKA